MLHCCTEGSVLLENGYCRFGNIHLEFDVVCFRYKNRHCDHFHMYFMCNTDAVIKNIMVSVADRCCTKARGVVGMHTKRKVSTATAVV